MGLLGFYPLPHQLRLDNPPFYGLTPTIVQLLIDTQLFRQRAPRQSKSNIAETREQIAFLTPLLAMVKAGNKCGVLNNVQANWIKLNRAQASSRFGKIGADRALVKQRVIFDTHKALFCQTAITTDPTQEPEPEPQPMVELTIQEKGRKVQNMTLQANQIVRIRGVR